VSLGVTPSPRSCFRNSNTAVNEHKSGDGLAMMMFIGY
jgi:hypothetical protein